VSDWAGLSQFFFLAGCCLLLLLAFAACICCLLLLFAFSIRHFQHASAATCHPALSTCISCHLPSGTFNMHQLPPATRYFQHASAFFLNSRSLRERGIATATATASTVASTAVALTAVASAGAVSLTVTVIVSVIILPLFLLLFCRYSVIFCVSAAFTQNLYIQNVLFFGFAHTDTLTGSVCEAKIRMAIFNLNLQVKNSTKLAFRCFFEFGLSKSKFLYTLPT